MNGTTETVLICTKVSVRLCSHENTCLWDCAYMRTGISKTVLKICWGHTTSVASSIRSKLTVRRFQELMIWSHMGWNLFNWTVCYFPYFQQHCMQPNSTVACSEDSKHTQTDWSIVCCCKWQVCGTHAHQQMNMIEWSFESTFSIFFNRDQLQSTHFNTFFQLNHFQMLSDHLMTSLIQFLEPPAFSSRSILAPRYFYLCPLNWHKLLLNHNRA